MNGTYTLYKRDPDGTQGDMIPDFTTLEITLKWGKVSKIHVEGVSRTGETPLSIGDGLIVYRNGEFFIGGVVSNMETDCPDPANGVKYWSAEGDDDTILLARRQILADPVNLTFNQDAYDKAEGFSHNRIIHYIYNDCWKGTTSDRWLANEMTLPSERPVGTEGVSAYRSVVMTKALTEIGKEDDLFPQLSRDPKTGDATVLIPEARDMTGTIIISPNYGNITSWSRRDKLPDFNAIWVVSGDYGRGRLYVYAEDLESIAAYGRIETVVVKSDAKVWEEGDPEDEDEGGEEEHLTEEDVIAILEQEARTQLIEHGVKRSWSVAVVETQDLAFMVNWQVGDLVTCVCDGEKFQTQITQARITFAQGIETVEPTVGTIERGIFGQLFDQINGLDDRITRKENE